MLDERCPEEEGGDVVFSRAAWDNRGETAGKQRNALSPFRLPTHSLPSTRTHLSVVPIRRKGH